MPQIRGAETPQRFKLACGEGGFMEGGPLLDPPKTCIITSPHQLKTHCFVLWGHLCQLDSNVEMAVANER